MTACPRSLILSQAVNAIGDMEALDFCQFWLEIKPWQAQERGFRAKCVRFIAQSLKISERTVEKWGTQFENTPSWAKVALGYLHALSSQQL